MHGRAGVDVVRPIYENEHTAKKEARIYEWLRQRGYEPRHMPRAYRLDAVLDRKSVV